MQVRTPNATPPTRVLLVEDELDDAQAVRLGLPQEEGFEITHVRSGEEGIQKAAREPFDAALVDHRLQDLSGIQVCKKLREGGFAGPVLLLSSIEVEDTISQALGAGADEFIRKTHDYGDRLRDCIAMLRVV